MQTQKNGEIPNQITRGTAMVPHDAVRDFPDSDWTASPEAAIQSLLPRVDDVHQTR